MKIFRKPADPLGPGPVRCAYCVDDYLAWQRDPAGKEAPEVGQALTVLPSASAEPGAGAAVCLAHLRALKRYRGHDPGSAGPLIGHLPAYKVPQPKESGAAHPQTMPRVAPA